MSDQSQDIINEYKDQIRILKNQIAELEDAFEISLENFCLLFVN